MSFTIVKYRKITFYIHDSSTMTTLRFTKLQEIHVHSFREFLDDFMTFEFISENGAETFFKLRSLLSLNTQALITCSIHLNSDLVS